MMILRCFGGRRLLFGVLAILLLLIGRGQESSAQENGDEELIGLIAEWLTGDDADLRTLALEQVRTEAKGAAATQRFAALLPSLSAERQVSLLQALAERRDGVARPAVLNLLPSPVEEVRVAALRALGDLGTAEDLAVLVQRLPSTSEAERVTAAASLVRLPGDETARLLSKQMELAKDPSTRVRLIEILAERRAIVAIPDLLSVGSSTELQVRQAAMVAVGALGRPEDVAKLSSLVVRAQPKDRDIIEKAIAAIYSRHPDLAQQPMHPLLEEFFKLSGDDQAALLPAVGRVGGPRAREVVDWYLKHPYAFVSDVGWRALSLWPDASVAPELLAAVEKPFSDQRRSLAFRALVRVAGLQDEKRDVQQRLDWLKAAARLAQDDDERVLVIKRLSSVRHVESLRFAISFLDQPKFTEFACQSIVELAHLRWLRDEFKDEFATALDRVQAVSRDQIVLERAQRYKEGKTWTGPGVGS
ncbi:MAG: HEAT repeat domain-containing protein [Planctomycetaceae bacterium]|nr:HEAT repeat domain-containing protein [Planctomycetaceae bacterium]